VAAERAPAAATPLRPDAHAVGFTRRLRDAGIDVAVGSTLLYVQALSLIDALSRQEIYWAGRATLVRDVDDVATYDHVFASYWGRDGGRDENLPVEPVAFDLAVEDPDADAAGPGEPPPDEREGRPTLVVRASDIEVLRHKDFAACTDSELAEAHRLMDDVRWAAALRRSRRLRPVGGNRRSTRPDVRATIRRSVRAGGELVAPSRRAPAAKPRPLVLLLDVSGSMDPYARALARFAHAAVSRRRRGRVEVFALGTRLTRLTRALSSRDPDEALRAAAAAAADWSGGTRLGAGLRTFNDDWGVRGLARGAVAVILSDGWDRGDPDQLAEQMARLRRVAHRVVWVNPLKATEGYEPLARGMAAALPYVDDFVEGHSLAALEALAARVGEP